MLRGENSLSKENRLILDWIKAHPMCTMNEVSEGVGMEMNEVVRRVMKMKGGVVKRCKRDGKNVYCYAEICTFGTMGRAYTEKVKPVKVPVNRDTASINTCYLTFNGERKTCKEWGQIVGIDPWTILKRIRSGWDDERALTTLHNPSCHIISFNGEEHSIREWERILGFNRGLISHRLNRGWSQEKALTTPVIKNNKKAV